MGLKHRVTPDVYHLSVSERVEFWLLYDCRTHYNSVCASGSRIGVEPEPFEMGQHLIDASGKLCLLDSMLTFLHKGCAHLLFGSTWWFSAVVLLFL